MGKHIKLMADYHAAPLWDLDADSVGPIDPADLPLSNETILRLKKWSADYDAQLNDGNPARSGFANRAELLAFERERIELWRRLQEELGSEFQVEYFSEVMQKSAGVLVGRCRQMLEEGSGAEEVMAYLKAESASKTAAIAVVTEVFRLTISEAKVMVHKSRAWQAVRERDETIHETFISEVTRKAKKKKGA